MRLLLVFPPFTDASQPNAAIPSLAAALRGSEVRVEVCDANVDAWEYLLDTRRQTRWLDQAQRRFRALDRKTTLSPAEKAAYLVLVEGCLRGEAALPHIPEALATLRSGRFYSRGAYAQAQSTIRGALALVSAAFYPAKLDWGRFWPACRVQSSQAVVKAAGDRRSNPFAGYARESFLPQIRDLQPGLIGFSITYLDQVLPALTLARACRRHLPGVPIVFGGQIVSLWGDDILRAKALWRWVDYFVTGEGETALRELVRHLREGTPLASVPNLIAPSAGAHRTSFRRENLADLPCPDYSCVPLDRYLSPEPVLLVSASRGCYWGKCAFCSVSPGFRPGYRVRPISAVLDDLRQLTTRFAARSVMFGDDALPPTLVQALVRDGLDRVDQVFWQAEIRWDALRPEWMAALARAGARNLVVGLESGSARVLKDMRKGNSLPHARAILQASARAGIGVNLQCFLGFPTETLAQARETVRFIGEFVGGGVTASCGKFVLVKNSPLWREPGRFGIRKPSERSDEDLPVQHDWPPRYGVKRQQQLLQAVERSAPGMAPQLSCGINAHALLYLAFGPGRDEESGPGFDPRGPLALGPGVAARSVAWDPASLGPRARPRRRPTTVALSLACPSLHILAPLSEGLLGACQGTVTGTELVTGLNAAERRRVLARLRWLARQGLVTNPPP